MWSSLNTLPQSLELRSKSCHSFSRQGEKYLFFGTSSLSPSSNFCCLHFFLCSFLSPQHWWLAEERTRRLRRSGKEDVGSSCCATHPQWHFGGKCPLLPEHSTGSSQEGQSLALTPKRTKSSSPPTNLVLLPRTESSHGILKFWKWRGGITPLFIARQGEASRNPKFLCHQSFGM